MMKVENTAHCPERYIVDRPTNEEPYASVKGLLISVFFIKYFYVFTLIIFLFSTPPLFSATNNVIIVSVNVIF
jgi:hypothetical protein